MDSDNNSAETRGQRLLYIIIDDKHVTLAKLCAEKEQYLDARRITVQRGLDDSPTMHHDIDRLLSACKDMKEMVYFSMHMPMLTASNITSMRELVVSNKDTLEQIDIACELESRISMITCCYAYLLLVRSLVDCKCLKKINVGMLIYDWIIGGDGIVKLDSNYENDTVEYYIKLCKDLGFHMAMQGGWLGDAILGRNKELHAANRRICALRPAARQLGSPLPNEIASIIGLSVVEKIHHVTLENQCKDLDGIIDSVKKLIKNDVVEVSTDGRPLKKHRGELTV